MAAQVAEALSGWSEREDFTLYAPQSDCRMQALLSTHAAANYWKRGEKRWNGGVGGSMSRT